MTEDVKIPNYGERLKRALDNFELNGGHTPAGTFLAYSETEPLFCYERNTVEELAEVVSDTLRSYAMTFYHVNLDVHLELVPASSPSIPVERIEPGLRLVPSFGADWNDRELVGTG